MRLRSKISAELQARLEVIMPQAMGTVWDTQAVLVMVEDLSFKPASGFKGNWQSKTSFKGFIRAELRHDKIDDLAAESLIASLLKDPLHVHLPDEADKDEMHVKARLILANWRDTVRDAFVVGALRFNVEGEVCAFAPEPAVPAPAEPEYELRHG
ncbi:MAG: hypothetical protein N4A70_05560 [Pelagimonas sp.]|jgi:hypothetical protein|nr:hypothetical protein [Pelagimonas sp.]